MEEAAAFCPPGSPLPNLAQDRVTHERQGDERQYARSSGQKT